MNITVVHFDDTMYFATLRAFGFIQLPINIFGLYLIIYISPKSMTYYYKCLLVKYQILYVLLHLLVFFFKLNF